MQVGLGTEVTQLATMHGATYAYLLESSSVPRLVWVY